MADKTPASTPQQAADGTGPKPISDGKFDDIIRERELQAIATRRQHLQELNKDDSTAFLHGDWGDPPDGDLVGLALSGGGIRSATFNLGLLQKLAELKILPLVDYLSTVSGGGFIGGWWSSWMHRLAGQPKNRGQWLPVAAPGHPHEEPSEIEHLRLYSNYLIPRKGLFSGDTWRAITVVLRNLIVTQVVVASLLAAFFLLVDWIYVAWLPPGTMLNLATTGASAAARFDVLWKWPLLAVAAIWFGFTVFFLCVASGEYPARQIARSRVTQWHARFAATVAVLAGVFALAGFSDRLLCWLNLQVWKQGGWLAVLPGVASAIYTAFQKAPAGGGDPALAKKAGLGTFVQKLAPGLSLLTLAVLLAAGAWRLLRETFDYMNSAAAPAKPGWVFLLSLLAVFGISQVYFLRSLSTRRLAWRARFDEVRSMLKDRAKLRSSISESDPQDAGIIAIAFFSFACGWLLYSTYAYHRAEWWVCLACFLVVAQVACGAGFATDPNALSMHNFYKSRLVRAYLGATNPARLEELQKSCEDVTRSKANDDLPLCDLQPWKHGGPVHILNTTLNLVGAKDLTAEQRQAEVFELTPLFCGSLRSGYRPTDEYADACLTLGTSVAISGAAASPNMGPSTSAPLALLMAFFNIRLGYWIANPASRHAWRYPWTRFWLWYLFREMFGQTTAQGKFSFLSDGGHLENLGLYALVKRRCRFIIVADAGADPGFFCGDLATALRMIRIDFGCEVRIDVSGIQKRTDHNGVLCSKLHCAVGTIQYPLGAFHPSDPEKNTGLLIYLKNSLTTSAPADVLSYARTHPPFPHQTTADQFFDEAQFESYRRLGTQVAESVFGDLQFPANQVLTREKLFSLVEKKFPG